MSYYAPTKAASRQEKNTFFFDELTTISLSVPAGEKYIVLGDFNAHVGSKQVVGDQWSKGGVRIAVESPMMQGRSYLDFSLPSKKLYVIHGSGRKRYTEYGNIPSQSSGVV